MRVTRCSFIRELDETLGERKRNPKREREKEKKRKRKKDKMKEREIFMQIIYAKSNKDWLNLINKK